MVMEIDTCPCCGREIPFNFVPVKDKITKKYFKICSSCFAEKRHIKPPDVPKPYPDQ